MKHFADHKDWKAKKSKSHQAYKNSIAMTLNFSPPVKLVKIKIEALLFILIHTLNSINLLNVHIILPLMKKVKANKIEENFRHKN